MFTDANGDIDMEEVGDFIKDCIIGWLQAKIAIVVISISAILQLFGEIGFFSGVQHPLVYVIGFCLMCCVLAWFWFLCVYFITLIFALVHPTLHKALCWIIWIITTGFIVLVMFQGSMYQLQDKNVTVHYGKHYVDRGYQSI